MVHWNSLEKHYVIRAVASGEARGAAAPLGRTCWDRHIKSVDGFVFFKLSYFDYSDLQLFAIFIFEVDFYHLTSAENSVSEPPNWKFSGGGQPQTPLQVSCLCPRDNVPRYKKPSNGPGDSRLLGVLIDDQLNWSKHISVVKKRFCW